MNSPERVVDIHTFRNNVEIRDIFSKCGKILGFLPWKTEKSPKNHFFIEFADKDDVERAKDVVRKHGHGANNNKSQTSIQLHCLVANANMQARFRLMARGEPSLKRQRVEEADDDRDRACTPPNPPPPKRVVAVARARLTTPRPNFASQARMNAPVPLYRRMQSPEVAKVGNGNVPQRGRTNERSYALPHQQQDQYSYSKNRFSPPRRNYSQSLARSFSPRPRDYSPYNNRRHDSVSSVRSRPYSPLRNLPARRVPYSPPRRNSTSTDISVPGPSNLLSVGTETTDHSIASTCVSPNQGPIVISIPSSIPGLSLTCSKSPVRPTSPSPLTADSGISLPSIACSDTSIQNSTIEARDSMQTSSLLSFHSFSGQETIDMSKLDRNPTTVIESLRKSHCGPEVWMMLGANYRRTQLPDAALQVITALIEDMKARGCKDSDLKPAFLIIAQCNYDIAKQRAREPRDSEEASHERFLSTLEWLRQAYGTHSERYVSPTPRIPTGPRKRDASCFESDNVDQKSTKDAFARASEPYGSSSPSYKRIQILQSELNVLRSSQVTSASILESTKKARLAAEDELESQRGKYRRLERRLDDLEDDLDAARRTAAKAEKKAEEEGHARRCAEARLEEERRAWPARECALREEAAKAVMSDLANVLARAAQAPSSMWDSIGVSGGGNGALLGNRS